MKIKCKKCGTQYSISDSLITEKGVKLRCKRCGATFIVRKRVKSGEIKIAPPRRAEAPSRRGPEKKGFFSELKSASWPLRLFFVVAVLVFIAEISYIAYRFSDVRRKEEWLYLVRNYQHGYFRDFLKEARSFAERRKDPYILFLLADAYYLLHSSKARSYFEKAAGLVKDKAVRASLLVRAGRTEEGLQMLKELLLSEEKRHLEISNDLAVALLKKRPEEGLRMLKKLSQALDYVARFNIAVYFIESGNYTEARKIVEYLYGMYPGDPAAMVNLAYVFLMEKKPDEALQVLRMAEGRHKFLPLVIHNMRIAYEKLKSEKSKIYEAKDLIKEEKPLWVPYIFLLNPEMKP